MPQARVVFSCLAHENSIAIMAHLWTRGSGAIHIYLKLRICIIQIQEADIIMLPISDYFIKTIEDVMWTLCCKVLNKPQRTPKLSIRLQCPSKKIFNKIHEENAIRNKDAYGMIIYLFIHLFI